MCARVMLTGQFSQVSDETEIAKAKVGLFERHPEMATWPDDHGFVVNKIDITDIFLLDFYGGGATPTPEEYYKVTM